MEKLITIAKIHNDFPTKFGLPRQSGLVDELKSVVVFEPKYQNPDALRGLEGFSHIWLIWGFSEVDADDWSPTVRPPRLGGNERRGVFATRSPYRPNPIGLSSVKLEKIEETTAFGRVLVVSGADLMDNTPIYDIKPYLSLTDAHVEASDGFAAEVKDYALKVEIPEKFLSLLSDEKMETLRKILSQDPRPAYQRAEIRVYGFLYAGYEIKFSVLDGVLTVSDIIKTNE